MNRNDERRSLLLPQKRPSARPILACGEARLPSDQRLLLARVAGSSVPLSVKDASISTWRGAPKSRGERGPPSGLLGVPRTAPISIARSSPRTSPADLMWQCFEAQRLCEVVKIRDLDALDCERSTARGDERRDGLGILIWVTE